MFPQQEKRDVTHVDASDLKNLMLKNLLKNKRPPFLYPTDIHSVRYCLPIGTVSGIRI